jgi:hypothetical protein
MKPITRREAIKKSGRLLLGASACSLLPRFGTGCTQREVDTKLAARLMQNTQNAKLDRTFRTLTSTNLTIFCIL